MQIFQFTLPNMLGYAAVGYLLLQALAHRSAARELKGLTQKAARHLDENLPKPPQRGLATARTVDRDWSMLAATAVRGAAEHPTAGVLAKLTDNTDLADDEMAIDAWMVGALQDHIGPLRNACEMTAGTAAPIGLLGTIAGFVIGTYTFAQGQDTSALMGSIAMALLTTFVASIVVMLERRLVKGTLEPLEMECALHAQEWIARARALLRWKKARARRARHQPAKTPRPSSRPSPQCAPQPARSTS